MAQPRLYVGLQHKKEGESGTHPPAGFPLKVVICVTEIARKTIGVCFWVSYLCVTGIKYMTHLQMLYTEKKKVPYGAIYFWGMIQLTYFRHWHFNMMNQTLRVPVFLSTDVRESQRQVSMKYSQCIAHGPGKINNGKGGFKTVSVELVLCSSH